MLYNIKIIIFLKIWNSIGSTKEMESKRLEDHDIP